MRLPSREECLSELQQLRLSDPETLIGLYRELMGLGQFGEIPPDVSLATMIVEILEHEATHGNLSDCSA